MYLGNVQDRVTTDLTPECSLKVLVHYILSPGQFSEQLLLNPEYETDSVSCNIIWTNIYPPWYFSSIFLFSSAVYAWSIDTNRTWLPDSGRCTCTSHISRQRDRSGNGTVRYSTSSKEEYNVHPRMPIIYPFIPSINHPSLPCPADPSNLEAIWPLHIPHQQHLVFSVQSCLLQTSCLTPSASPAVTVFPVFLIFSKTVP